jgi:hypothetical protein
MMPPGRRRLERKRVGMVVTCECGWMSRGDEDCVVEAMQVHVRQIHGRELTRAQVLARAQASEGQD